MKTHWRFLIPVLAVSVGAALFSGCAESASSGGSTSIPQVIINCTTPRCYSNSSPVVHVFITQYDCASVNSDLLAVVSSSLFINCTASSGCYGVTTGWINDKSETTSSMPSGTYTVCGRIDYNNNYPGVKTDDTTSINESVSVSSASSGPVSLTVWTDP